MGDDDVVIVSLMAAGRLGCWTIRLDQPLMLDEHDLFALIQKIKGVGSISIVDIDEWSALVECSPDVPSQTLWRLVNGIDQSLNTKVVQFRPRE